MVEEHACLQPSATPGECEREPRQLYFRPLGARGILSLLNMVHSRFTSEHVVLVFLLLNNHSRCLTTFYIPDEKTTTEKERETRRQHSNRLHTPAPKNFDRTATTTTTAAHHESPERGDPCLWSGKPRPSTDGWSPDDTAYVLQFARAVPDTPKHRTTRGYTYRERAFSFTHGAVLREKTQFSDCPTRYLGEEKISQSEDTAGDAQSKTRMLPTTV